MNKLTKELQHNYQNRISHNDFDMVQETEDLLNEVGASLEEFGGKLSFYGKDPVIPSVLRYAGFSAITLAAKAAQIASIWKMKTGETQDIHIDIRRALRRFSPFIEMRHETVNGLAGMFYSDPFNPYAKGDFFQTKDGRYVFPTNIYPALRKAAMELLEVSDDLIPEAISKWDAAELEKAAEKSGAVFPMLRSLEEFMKEQVYADISKEPLIKIEK
ncbi:hypothetical protein [Sphingobacterium hungaricum]